MPSPLPPAFGFGLVEGYAIMRQGDRIWLEKGEEVLLEMTLEVFASIVSSLSPHQEANGSYDFVLDFLREGIMYCCGCGKKLTPAEPGGGRLGILNGLACESCYRQKFKPLLDYARPTSPNSLP